MYILRAKIKSLRGKSRKIWRHKNFPDRMSNFPTFSGLQNSPTIPGLLEPCFNLITGLAGEHADCKKNLGEELMAWGIKCKRYIWSSRCQCHPHPSSLASLKSSASLPSFPGKRLKACNHVGHCKLFSTMAVYSMEHKKHDYVEY